MLLDASEHWAAELRSRALRARSIGEFLAVEDLACIGDTLFVGAAIARRLLEEGITGSKQLKSGKVSVHFADSECLALDAVAARPIHLSGCWNLEKNIGKLELNRTETLSAYDLLSQIIHADPLQLYKSPNFERPCFWVASDGAMKKKRMKFFRVYWDCFAELLEAIAYATTPTRS